MNLEKFYPNLTPAAARRSQQLSLPLLSFSLKKRRATVETPIYIGFAVFGQSGIYGGFDGDNMTGLCIHLFF
jgi:hypothetical protein